MYNDFVNKKQLAGENSLSEYILPSSAFKFDLPNFSLISKERVKRNKAFLKRIHATLDSKNCQPISIEETAAIKIQKLFRGYIGRKKYFDILYESIQKDEDLTKQFQKQQIIESEALIDSYRLERELDDEVVVVRNKIRFLNAKATIIQRAWRKKKGLYKKEHICCLCNDEYFPNLYEYYNKTKLVCFCCKIHKVNGYPNLLEVCTTAVHEENVLEKYKLDNKARATSSLNPNSFFWGYVDRNELGNNVKQEYNPENVTKQTSCENYDEKISNNFVLFQKVLESPKVQMYLKYKNIVSKNAESFYIENLSLQDLNWIIDHLEKT